MNRIIIIGNGFDLAHNLPTAYHDFLDHYWNNFQKKAFDHLSVKHFENNLGKEYSDEFTIMQIVENSTTSYDLEIPKEKVDKYSLLLRQIKDFNSTHSFKNIDLTFSNEFFGHICSQHALNNWVDIENEYYSELKKILLLQNKQQRNTKVKKLNSDFEAIKKSLEEFLIDIISSRTNSPQHNSIEYAFKSLIEFKDVAINKQTDFLELIFDSIPPNYSANGNMSINNIPINVRWQNEENRKEYVLEQLKDIHFKMRYCAPKNIILNFNYTQTARHLYLQQGDEVINIHGELNNNENPIIFGYGDEMDDEYREIENQQDNEFFENIKSVRYLQTQNYKKLLSVIESCPYQVFLMGHSCGNSDRTLLNTLFEHDNCISIKAFYHQKEDGTDDFSNLARNIYRNFKNKQKMRDIVVNKEYCSPLVPISTKQ